MKLKKFVIVILLAVALFQNCLGVEEVRNIYVDGSSSLEIFHNGTEEEPFKDIDEGLEAASQAMPDYKQVNLLIAQNEESYKLKKTLYEFATDPSKGGGFTLTTWVKNNTAEQGRAILEFGEASWQLRVETFTIQNVDMITQKGSIVGKGKFFKMQDMKISTSLLTQERFLNLTNHRIIKMRSLSFLMENATPFLIYQDEETASIPATKVDVENIAFALPTFREMDENQLCLLPMLDFTSRGGALINIENVTLGSLEKGKVAAFTSLVRMRNFQTVNVVGIQIEQQHLHVKSCELMAFESNANVLIKNITLSGSRLLTKEHFVFFRVRKALIFKMDDIKVVSNNFEMQSEENSYLVRLSEAFSSEFTNHFVIENAFNGSMQMLKLEDSDTNDKFKSQIPKLENITLKRNQNFERKRQFSYFALQSGKVKRLTVKNFLFSENQISGSIVDFLIYTNELKSSEFDISSNFPIEMRGLRIEGNKGRSDLTFFVMRSVESELKSLGCISITEPYSLSFEDLKIINNSFSKFEEESEDSDSVSLFRIGWSQILIENAQIENNAFQSYNLLKLDQKAQTVVFSKVEFSNNSLESSKLINSDSSKVKTPCIQNQEKGKDKPNASILYRHIVVVDSVFTGGFLNASVLFDLNHGFLIYENNRFSQIELFNNSIFLINRFTLPRLPLRSARHSIDTWMIRVLANQEPQTYKLWQAALQEMLLDDNDLLYFSRIKHNTFYDMIFGTSSFLVLGSNYGEAQNMILIQENKFGKVEFRHAGELSSLFSCETLSKMVIQGNKFENIHGNISLFYLPSTTDSQRLVLNSNKLLNVSGLNFLVFRSERLGTFEFNSNQIIQTNFSQSFLNVKARRIAGDLVLDGNDVLESKLLVKVLNKQVTRYGLIFISSSEAEDSSKIVLRSNKFSKIVLSDAEVSNPAGEVSILMINSYQSIYFENNTWADIKGAREGDLIHVSNAPSLKISESKIFNIDFSSSKGFMNVLTPNLVIENSIFRNIVNDKTYGLVYLAPSGGDYRITIVENTFDEIENTFYANVLTVIPLKNEEFRLSLEWTGCNATDLYNGLVFLRGGECVDCFLKNTIIRAENLNFQEGMVRLENFSGDLEFSNVILPVLGDAQTPRISMKENRAALVLRNIEYHGGRGSVFYLIELDGGDLTIQDCLFSNFDIIDFPLIHTTLPYFLPIEKIYSNFRFQNVTFHSIKSGVADFKLNHNPVFSIALPGSFIIENCTFENISNVRVIEAYGLIKKSGENCKNPKRSLLMIKDSTFTQLKYHYGPAVHISPNCLNPEIIVNHSLFTDSKASYGGGAISLSNNATLEVTNTIFKNLQAAEIAAAILAPEDTLRNIKLNNPSFINNTARYPGNISSPAIKFSLKFVSLNDYESEDGKILMDISNADFQFGYFKVNFLDANDEPAPELSPSREIFFSVPVFEKNEVTSEKVMTNNTFPATVDCSVFSCNVYPQGVKLAGKAFELLNLTFSYKSLTLQQTRNVSIQLRPCQLGEFNNSNICEPCAFQTYSLDPSVPCTRCPWNAFCPDPVTICPKSGYWNFDNKTIEVLKCKDEKAGRCERREGECRTCKEGYTGPFCSACDFDNRFVETGYFECTFCENPRKTLLFVILGGVLYFFCQMAIFSVLYKDIIQSEESQANKTQRSFYINTLVNYAQLMSILCLTSSQIYQHFGISSQIGSLSSLITYGTQCSMFALGIEHQDFIYYQTVLITLLPIIQILIGAFCIMVADRCGLLNTNRKIKEILCLMSIYIFLVSQPGLVANLTLFLSCTDLNDQGVKSWISSHPNWSCTTPEYRFVARFITFPNFILWTILIPIFFAQLLRKGKNKELLIRWLSSGLKDEKKYWVLVSMVFKLILGVLVYELGVQVDIQIFSSLLLLWLYQVFARLLKPYSISALNEFEVRMINLLMLNIVVAKYLLDDASSMGHLINQISFYGIVVTNVAFFVNAVWKVITLSIYKKDLEDGLLAPLSSNEQIEK